MATSSQQRETDVLADMLAADSGRIDQLVGRVGEVRGEVTGLRIDVSRVAQGVDDLRDAMTVLSRHAVLMETQGQDIAKVRASVDLLDGRVRSIETEMPSLKETRSYTVRAAVAVIAAVGLALLALVIKK